MLLPYCLTMYQASREILAPRRPELPSFQLAQHIFIPQTSLSSHPNKQFDHPPRIPSSPHLQNVRRQTGYGRCPAQSLLRFC
jgi:hypothetical protein